jgi:hypothetical protein
MCLFQLPPTIGFDTNCCACASLVTDTVYVPATAVELALAVRVLGELEVAVWALNALGVSSAASEV